MKSLNFECCVGMIYGPNDRLERNNVFGEHKHAIEAINKPVLIMGDFNAILHSVERVESFRCDLSIKNFSDWIQDLGLLDLPLHGIKFTWRRNDSKSRLDRALCCNQWLSKFSNMILLGKERSVSDHNPLVLLTDSLTNWGPKPFRRYDAWFMNPNFKNVIINEWQNL